MILRFQRNGISGHAWRAAHSSGQYIIVGLRDGGDRWRYTAFHYPANGSAGIPITKNQNIMRAREAMEACQAHAKCDDYTVLEEI